MELLRREKYLKNIIRTTPELPDFHRDTLEKHVSTPFRNSCNKFNDCKDTYFFVLIPRCPVFVVFLLSNKISCHRCHYFQHPLEQELRLISSSRDGKKATYSVSTQTQKGKQKHQPQYSLKKHDHIPTHAAPPPAACRRRKPRHSKPCHLRRPCHYRRWRLSLRRTVELRLSRQPPLLSFCPRGAQN